MTRNASERWHAIVSGHARGPIPSLQRVALRAASWPYGLASRLRNRFYDVGWFRRDVATAPVISIGNLTLGGTGKTPCVEFVARYLNDSGHRVAILSRGFGSSAGPNDEALVLEKNLPDVPHLQGTDRAEMAKIAIEELESEVLVLDDGFQHRKLARTLDIVLIDATNPWGLGYLFPRGQLREPLAGLRRAHAVIATRCDLVERTVVDSIHQRVAKIAPKLPVFEATHAPLHFVNSEGVTRALGEFAGKSSLSFCGIGNPRAFRQTLARLDVEPREWRHFPDHHAYSRQDVDELERWAEASADEFVLTTQKDLVKLRIPTLGARELWALRVGFEVRVGKDQLLQMLGDATR